MSIVKKILSRIARQSSWYNEVVFQDCAKFWKIDNYQIEVVNLGSNSAKFGFDYSEYNNTGYNWAMGPQSLMMDLNILQCYYSYLKPGATVIIPLCPFSCLVGYDYLYFTDKYYTVLNHAQIPFFNVHKRVMMNDMMNNPGKYIPFVEVMKIMAYKIAFWHKRKNNTVTDFEKDSLVFINSWKHQFFLKDFDNELSCLNKNSYLESQEILGKIVDFCKRYGFKPVVVMPPVSPALKKYFSSKAIDRFVVDYVNGAIGKDVLFLNYLNSNDFSDFSLYRNSYYLNEKGARLFTKNVLNDINKAQ